MAKGNYKNGRIVCAVVICVRSIPDMNAGPFCDLENGTEVIVDLDDSTSKFYRVSTTYGIDGYVPVQYVRLDE